MRKFPIDYRILFGLIIAHFFMYITFQDKAIFWYMFTATMLILMSYSILHEKSDQQASFFMYSIYGILSGMLLFALFWIGHFLIQFFQLPFKQEISKLYTSFAPKEIWHYIVLLLFIVPGEELFWRGFIQKRLSKFLNIRYSILVAALLYASVQIYSGFIIHAIAALIAGLFWGALYAWKKSLSLVIVSHLTFDVLLFILLPFR
ncbi:CPBP family intramembrane glutamic endopeptidase [Bacillus tuaregi]|uniref:CPBP family intramembrane glutamic endopeptidase n=1 Tax=Bacillus tuaregi TaxID=1816695 RepID=UPI001F3E4909|nr:type II CAAX endopeptidase family protein [Bacillus tuaregi]